MNRLQRFMIGRYGADELSTVLIMLSIIFSLTVRSHNNRILEILKVIIPLIPLYRMFSRNINRRYQENLKFLKFWNPIRRKINKFTGRIKGFKDYRHFKCTNCKQTLRVPRGKGRISVTCPKCKIVMIKKS